MKSGLPIKYFMAACNANDVVPKYLNTHQYIAQQSVSTISNAMDVGDPSNFVRILKMFNSDVNLLKEIFSSVSISDLETKHTIQRVFAEDNYLLDPHGAVGFLALEKYLATHPNQQGFFAETAHPIKFNDVVEPLINQTIPTLPSILNMVNKEKKSKKVEVDYEEFHDYLLSIK